MRIQCPKVICIDFPYLSLDKLSNIRCKPQKFSMESDYFKIGIENDASTNISNVSSNFVGTITTVKGKTVKVFGGVIQVKGEGTILKNRI